VTAGEVRIVTRGRRSREASQRVINEFGDPVRALRGTESRRSTVSDSPILLGIHRPLEENLAHLGAP
jgi:chlorite dismutase